MPSLWKDLLFLHGHLTQASLIWSDTETAAKPADAATKKAAPDTLACCVMNCCVTGWPRLMGPR